MKQLCEVFFSFHFCPFIFSELYIMNKYYFHAKKKLQKLKQKKKPN